MIRQSAALVVCCVLAGLAGCQSTQSVTPLAAAPRIAAAGFRPASEPATLGRSLQGSSIYVCETKACGGLTILAIAENTQPSGVAGVSSEELVRRSFRATGSARAALEQSDPRPAHGRQVRRLREDHAAFDRRRTRQRPFFRTLQRAGGGGRARGRRHALRR
jgi:hypothetical protein